MLDFSRFEWISFDCYGTLVDWETGIAAAVGEVLNSRGLHRSRTEILALYADAEPKVQTSPAYMEYRRVLRGVMGQIGSELGFRCTERSWTASRTPCPNGRSSLMSRPR